MLVFYYSHIPVLYLQKLKKILLSIEHINLRRIRSPKFILTSITNAIWHGDQNQIILSCDQTEILGQCGDGTLDGCSNNGVSEIGDFTDCNNSIIILL